MRGQDGRADLRQDDLEEGLLGVAAKVERCLIQLEDVYKRQTMSDTVVVMNGGKGQQIGTPEDIYNEPKKMWIRDRHCFQHTYHSRGQW